MTEPLLTKQCSKCGEWKTLAFFYPHRNAPLGRQSECIECCAERRAAIRADPKLVLRQRVAQRDNHSRRGREPEVAAARKRNDRLQMLKRKIAVETCKRLGINLTKLAKEQYDAEQKHREQTEQGLHQDRRPAKKNLRAAEG